MAKVLNMGLAPVHDPTFGISHSNIAKKLTKSNWQKKAVVRNGHYLFIKKGSYDVDGKKVYRYFVEGLPDKGKREFIDLDEAICFVNGYSDQEGEYPAEHDSTWTISIPFR